MQTDYHINRLENIAIALAFENTHRNRVRMRKTEREREADTTEHYGELQYKTAV